MGGLWRSRVITFPSINDLRPTPDRVRETLFNWLSPVIEGAVCLDLFAGSGALGFEAASRGAASVVMVETHRKALEHLEQNKSMLGADVVNIVAKEAFAYLKSTSTRFDIVFLDPPFSQNLVAKSCGQLEQRALLNNKAKIHIEMPVTVDHPKLPQNWIIDRCKRAGQLTYTLYTASCP